jgi:hypothetical protein
VYAPHTNGQYVFMSGINLLDWVTAIASIATAVGVLMAWWQIRLAKQQAITQFEDNMAREYREIALRLPVRALLGEELDEKEYAQALDDFYHYIDLSNEQTFLRQNKRISAETWKNWCDGIKSNLSRPAFRKAWEEIKSRANDSFAELRRLEASGFKDDPHSW